MQAGTAQAAEAELRFLGIEIREVRRGQRQGWVERSGTH